MGILVGMTVTARAKHRPALASLISMGLGALMPIGICALLAIMHGALGDSFRCLVYYPLNWNTHAFYYGHLLGPIGGAPLQVGSALFGLFVLVPIAARARARWKRRAIAVPFMASLFHLAGLLLLPATYLQYYLIALPLLAALTMVIVPSIRISLRAGGRTDPTIAKAAVISCALAFLIDTILWATSYRRVTFENCDMASLGLLIIGGLLFLRHNNAAIAVCWFALLTPSLGRIAREFDIHNKNDGQKAKIRFINELVKENEFVLDGFSGVACLRPHAFYWWWINEHTIPIIVREGKLQALQRCVIDGKPALIVYDSELAKLNTLLVPAMTAGYRPTVRQPDQNSFLLLLRKDLVDLSDEGQAEVSNGDTAPSTEDRTVR
jgi:hypothetical protein